MKITPADIQFELIAPGSMDEGRSCDGLTHKKTLPDLILVQAIEGHYEIAAGGRSVMLRTGSFFANAPGVPLTITHIVDKRTRKFRSRWVHLRCSLYGAVDVFSLFDIPAVIPRNVSTAMSAIIGTMLSHTEQDELAAAVAQNIAAFRIVQALFTVAAPRPDALLFHTNAARLLPLLEYIRNNLHRSISVVHLAEMASMSRSAFYQYFEKCVGVSPARYVETGRLSRAAELLRSPSDSISAIAERCGYKNQFHFSRTFKTFRFFPDTVPIHRRRHNGIVIALDRSHPTRCGVRRTILTAGYL